MVTPKSAEDACYCRGWTQVGLVTALTALSSVGSGPSVAQWINLSFTQPRPGAADAVAAVPGGGLGWTPEFGGLVYGSAAFAAGALTVLYGWLVDRVGPRRCGLLCCGLLAAACLAGSAAGGLAETAEIWLVCLVFSGCRNGFMQLIPRKLFVYWFLRRRGRAFGLVSVGNFVAGSIAPPLNTWALLTFGWRAAWAGWGVALLCFSGVAWLLLADRPAELPPAEQLPVEAAPAQSERDADDIMEQSERDAMLPADRAAAAAAAVDAASGTPHRRWLRPAEASFTLQQALQTRTLRCCFVLVFCRNFINDGLEFHLFPICEEAGIDAWGATALQSAIMMSCAAAAAVLGFLAERPRNLPWLNVYGPVAALIFLSLTQLMLATGTIAAGLAAAAVIGTAESQFFALTVGLPFFYGREHIGKISGVYYSVRLSGMALGPVSEKNSRRTAQASHLRSLLLTHKV
jgi:MFS family permease